MNQTIDAATTLFDRIAWRAEERPEAVAIEAPGRSALTYAELRDHLLSVVDTLNRAGVGRNDRVALSLPSGPEVATACLGVMTGAVAAPLNHQYRKPECEVALSALEPKLLIASDGPESPARGVARERGIPVASLRPVAGGAAGRFELVVEAGGAAPERGGAAGPDDLALVLFTSGTTARPKKVPLTQRNLAASAANLCRSLALGPDDGCLHVLPMFHIGGLIDVLAAPLTCGGRVIAASGFSAPEFFDCLRSFRPTWSQAVPAMLHELVRYAVEHREAEAAPSLRLMRSVSAALPAELSVRFEQVFDVPVIEIYGMTETAGVIASNPLDRAARKSGSVGVAAGVEIAVVDERGEASPQGSVGEVVVRGDCVMRGYEDASPEDAAATFFGSWFRTGDQGRLDDDGHLFLTGRLKEIINRGGEKISPGEIDEAVAAHPAVAECATFAVPHPSLGEDLAVGVVLERGATLSAPELLDYLRPRLAYFKLPCAVHFLPELPRSSGGKLQRNRLARELDLPAAEADGPQRPHEPPDGPIAETLVEMWERVLGISGIGIHADFFDLGGDSLKAASFVNELQRRWGEIVYVSALFDAPNVARFETYLRQSCPELVVKILGNRVSPEDRPAGSRVNADELSRFRRSIVPLAGPGKPPVERNRPAIFVLGTPRSGSTLLRAMLGGSSRLFAPPELFLLSFDDLSERRVWFSGSQRFLLEGNLRMLMQIKGLDLAAAQALAEEFETRRMPTAEYYRTLQEWLGERTLVDKTPFNAAHPETLARAEQYFQDSLYIHLVRHPYGMIRSFEEAKLDQLWYPRLVGTEAAARSPNPDGRRDFAEMIWMLLHENILSFLADVPAKRHYRLKFEDLVRVPEPTMRRLCRFLNLDFDSAMLDPHADAQERMTDGIHPVSRMIGDMKFHRHSTIDPAPADSWKQHYSADFLSDEAWKLAATLGYDETIARAQDREEFVI